jgi:hypothetical protein
VASILFIRTANARKLTHLQDVRAGAWMANGFQRGRE